MYGTGRSITEVEDEGSGVADFGGEGSGAFLASSILEAISPPIG